MNETSLIEWLRRDVASRKLSLSEEVMEALVDDAKRKIPIYLQKPPRLRPSHLARELEALTRDSEKTAKRFGQIGDQGLMTIAAAAGVDREPEATDMLRHAIYHKRMAAWCRQAAKLARDQSKSEEDHHGGRTPDYNLGDLVTHLIVAYQEILGIRPLYTVHKDSHVAENGVAAFIKQALARFAPERVFEGAHIDDLVRRALRVRDLEYFEPPAMPDEPDVSPSDEVMEALVDDAKRVIPIYLQKPRRLRPSHLARELETLTRDSEKIAKRFERIGDQGLMMIAAAAGVDREPEATDLPRHVTYHKRMAAWCRQAAKLARVQSKSAEDHHGGRTPDCNLGDLVTHLIVAYQEILGIRPLYPVHKDSHVAEQGVAAFIKQALARFAPERVFEGAHIDELVRRALGVRDLEYFEPPAMPDEPGV